MAKKVETIEELKPTNPNTVEDAANLLLSLLDPRVRDFVYEVADIVLKIPRWQLLLGSLLAQFESGTLTSPVIDPGWTTLTSLVTKTSYLCAFCGKEFSPRRLGQLYCSNTCGSLAARAKVVKDNATQRLI